MLSLAQYNQSISSHFLKDLKIYGFSVCEGGDFRLLTSERKAVVNFEKFSITSYLNFYIRLPKDNIYNTCIAYYIALDWNGLHRI